MIFGMVDDKDIKQVIKLLPHNATYYFTKAENKRALSEKDVQTIALQHGIRGIAYPSVVEAYEDAITHAAANDFIFIGGSSYLVGDFFKNCI